MRAKHRWMLLELDFGAGAGAAAYMPVTTADIFTAVRGAASDAFGDAGTGALAAGLSVRGYTARGGSGGRALVVIRGPLAAASQLATACALVRAVRRAPAALRCLRAASSGRALRAACRGDALDEELLRAMDVGTAEAAD